MSVKLLPPTEGYCNECEATVYLFDIPCEEFPGYEDLKGDTVTLCRDCLEYEGHPEYEYPELIYVR